MLRLTAVSSWSLALCLLSISACESAETPPEDDDQNEPRDSAMPKPDASMPRGDAGDAGLDARASDAAAVDARADGSSGGEGGAKDAGASDACVAFVTPAADSGAFRELGCEPPKDQALPNDLRCTGLYGDFDKKVPACNVVEYKPSLELWSDGAEKRRWVSIPAGKKVDVSNPNEFTYPDGTRFWKEFRVKNADGSMRLAETRLLEKREGFWLRTSYVWSADQKQAIQMDNMAGVPNLDGTGHTVPNRDQCGECHSGRADTILGWDAIMLGSGATGLSIAKLKELGWLEGELEAATIPGNEVEKAALGYLHANCGISCHNGNELAKAKDTGLYLKLDVEKLGSVQMTDAFTTSMNRPPSPNAKYDGLTVRDPTQWYDIRPGDPQHSLMVARQTIRGTEAQMPRIGTNKIDDAGVQIVTRWIESMTVDAGYPAPKPLGATQ